MNEVAPLGARVGLSQSTMKIAASRDVEVAGVQVGVTEHQIAWLRLGGFGMAG